jgi:hypothetical protein
MPFLVSRTKGEVCCGHGGWIEKQEEKGRGGGENEKDMLIGDIVMVWGPYQ